MGFGDGFDISIKEFGCGYNTRNNKRMIKDVMRGW
jgi:hypothetical protein